MIPFSYEICRIGKFIHTERRDSDFQRRKCGVTADRAQGFHQG
jgi:hypothetical protein